MILSGLEIKKRLGKDIIISPFDEKALNTNSYNLKLHNEFLVYDPAIRPEGIEYINNQLYEASESGDIEVVRIILKCGISVNTNNKNGNTLLHVAAMAGHEEVTSLLLKCGANVNTADNEGKTP